MPDYYPSVVICVDDLHLTTLDCDFISARLNDFEKGAYPSLAAV